MAIIRSVKRHSESGMWAYVETSDEDSTFVRIVGNKEFPTEQEAVDYSKGFSIDSYEWVEPSEMKINRLLLEKVKLQTRIDDINRELNF